MSTSTINCCNVNAFDYPCDLNNPDNPASKYPESTDPYGSTNALETSFLILSNFFLIYPALYALKYKNDMLRFDLNILALIFSCFFHLCKTKNDNVGVCIVSFCLLRTYDYIFSTSLLLSLLFLLEEYIIIKWIGHGKGKAHNELTLKKYRYFLFNAQIIILIFNGLILNILFNKTHLCSSTYSTYIFLIIIGSAFLINFVVTGFLYNFTTCEIFEKEKNEETSSLIYPTRNENWGIFLLGTILTVVALVFFLTKDYLDSNYYWLLHSLWHTFAAIGQILFLKLFDW